MGCFGHFWIFGPSTVELKNGQKALEISVDSSSMNPEGERNEELRITLQEEWHKGSSDYVKEIVGFDAPAIRSRTESKVEIT